MCTRWMSSSGKRQCLAAHAVMLLPGSACSKAMHTLRGSGPAVAVSTLALTDCGRELPRARLAPSISCPRFTMDLMRIFSLRADCTAPRQHFGAPFPECRLASVLLCTDVHRGSLTEGRMMRQGHLQRALTASLVLPRVLTPGTILVIAPERSLLPATRRTTGRAVTGSVQVRSTSLALSTGTPLAQ